MDNTSGKLLFVLVAAVLLAALAAWFVARRFRAALQAQMRLALPPGPPGGNLPPPVPPAEPPRAERLADNRAAGRRLAAGLIALSLLIALSYAALYHALLLEGPLSAGRVLTLGVLQLWPVIPVLGTLWRWSRRRTLAVLLGWALLAYAVVRWRSIEPPTALAILQYLAVLTAQPLLLYGLLAFGNTARAIAPWLVLPLAGLLWSSIASLDALSALVAQPPPWFLALTRQLGAEAVLLAFALLPWLLAWWPLKLLARGLAAAYERRWLSELMVLFAALWGLTLMGHAIDASTELGRLALLFLLPLAWIPLGVLGLAWARPPRPGRAPVLLVLRVFQRDRAMQRLFDAVIERWRLSGRTLLIAGTDLVERTLDGGDVIAFLDGRLGERFIRHVDQIAPRLAALQTEPDLDGRYRVEECYCHDATWQPTLAALLARSDVVLMDLRSFQQRHAGCRWELAHLAHAPALQRVVLLADAQTDRAAAEAAAAGAPPGRFVWIDATVIDARRRRAVLRALFAAERVAASAVERAAAPVGETSATG